MSPRLRLLMTSTALLALGAAPASAQPTGANVVGGTATVSGAGTNAVIVNQSSDRAIVNWNTFNISSGGSATFNQPGSSSITLNRVTGGLGPSVIDGTITANGRVFIINRDGMLFGRGAVINTAGFLASTNDIRNADFMAGRMNFNIPGRGNASIVNFGTITASSGGFAALVAPGVRNAGTISAHLGTVALASGNSFTLDMYGDKLIQVAVGDTIADKVIDVSTGRPLSSLVSNEGTLRANGGRVEITAAAARHVVDSVINNKGVIEANSVGTRAGRIVLGGATQTAGQPQQTIKISGKISATGKDKGSKGGTIQITGEDIQFAAAMLDVSGHSGGGKILVGGDYAGGKPIPDFVNNQSAVLEGYAIPTATTVTVDSATTFNASATVNGNGGKVILWSDVLTTFAGTIFARGGEQGGNGGFVEVSGKETLDFAGTVDTRAPNGQNGALLLDPRNINIVNTGADNIDATTPFANFTNYAPGPAPGSALTVTTLQAALANGDVYVTTGGNVAGNGQGDINVNSSFSWSSGSNLFLSAYRNINIANGVVISASGFVPQISLRADNTGTGVGTVTFNGNSRIAFGAESFGVVNIYYNPSSYTTPTDYSSRVTGGQFIIPPNAYMLVNSATDLQNISQNLGGTYALGRDIDASATATWNNGAGFIPIGNSATPFIGTFVGDGRTIDRLTINSAAPHVGLFGVIGSQSGCELSCLSGTVRDLRLTNVDITATAGPVGGIAGRVNGSSFLGGFSAISEVTVAGSVKGNGSAHVGGVAGENFGSISEAHANVAVRGGADALSVGGLVGFNGGFISTSYAIGSVTSLSPNPTGGLVGINACCAIVNEVGPLLGGINQTYASGPVSGSGITGGLVGQSIQGGTVVNSYWDTNTTKQQASAGGTPLTTSQALQRSSYQGFLFNDDDQGGWFMIDGQTRPVLVGELGFSTGPRFGVSIGNPHQLQLMQWVQDRITNAPFEVTSNINLGTALANPSDVWAGRSTGFIPIGSADKPYAGRFDGNGFTIDGLRIAPNNPTQQSVGLFHTIGAGGSVSNVNFVNADVKANIGFQQPFQEFQVSQWVGILAGQSGGTITNVTATGTISGLSVVGVMAGGLVGQHGILGPTNAAGSITNSWANVNVTVGNAGPCNPGSCMFNAAGGLVGVNVAGSSIANSHAGGNVSGGATTWAGGLVGQNGFFSLEGMTGTITNSYATGNVSVSGAQSAAGGLVGSQAPGSTITNSQAFGTVATTFNATSDNQFHDAGGLVGANSGTITSTTTPNALTASCTIGASFSCATGNISAGSSGSAGGLVGHNQGTINKSFATGNVTGADGLGFDGGMTHLGGLAGTNRGTISDTFARGTVGNIAANFVTAGGLVGDNAGTISNSTASGNVVVGNTSIAGGLAASNSSDNDEFNQGTGASNAATISNASASGNVSVGAGGFGGGFIGGNIGTVTDSFATGTVTGRALSMVGGFAAANGGTITNSHATGAVTTDTGFAGGFVGFNFGSIGLSYATGNVSSTGLAFVGGFVGMNSGTINQGYATGAVTGGPDSLAGGFVGLNVTADVSFIADGGGAGQRGVITQSYALGPVTGHNARVAGGFAALNLGSLDQVYGVGQVKGATTLGGLVGTNNLTAALPDIGGLPPQLAAPNGTATNSYWDMQTTGQTKSAGGTGMNTAVLAGGVPPGFDPAVWSHGSYPHLVNLGPQNTVPGPPVIPPVNENPETPQNLPPPDQQISQSTPGGTSITTSDPVPNTTQFVQQQTQQQAQQQPPGGSDPQTTGNVPSGPQPIRLDVGDPDRHFYLPPPEETRLVANEVVLQMPCNVPQTVIDGILKQHNLTIVASQCLSEGGNAAFRMRHASSQTIAGVIRALAAHQIIAAAQANYTYALTETSVQSATSQQGDPGQYITEKLSLFTAHRIVTGNGVSIGVIDSEIDGAHPDLTGAIANRYDATGVEDSPHAHGTGMAGAIVSHQRLLGVAPGARILAIRAFSTRSTNPESTTYHILRGIDWAVASNVRIINMSFAGPRDPSLERALKAANDKGIILIAAAGNAGPRAPAMYPAADPHVIAVTATDIDDRLFTGANRGNHVAIAAPGVDILVPAPAGEYQVTTGTSVATAHVSGVVALMLERNAKLTPADVRKILTASAKRLGPANLFGAGLIDPIRAIEMATPRSAAVPASPQPPAAAARPATTVAARP